MVNSKVLIVYDFEGNNRMSGIQQLDNSPYTALSTGFDHFLDNATVLQSQNMLSVKIPLTPVFVPPDALFSGTVVELTVYTTIPPQTLPNIPTDIADWYTSLQTWYNAAMQNSQDAIKDYDTTETNALEKGLLPNGESLGATPSKKRKNLKALGKVYADFLSETSKNIASSRKAMEEYHKYLESRADIASGARTYVQNSIAIMANNIMKKSDKINTRYNKIQNLKK
jgi:hypothetical protein